jgi:predicted transcriptional regulator/putative methionine-R-sulfoxide reductase with GAF domain
MKQNNRDLDDSLVSNKLLFMKEVCKDIKELENVAAIANTIIYNLVKTDKIAVAIIYENILRSLNSIGERTFIDLNLARPSVNLRAIKTKKTQIVHETCIDPDYFPGTAYSMEIHSELCAPIIYQGEVLGTVNLESRQADNFSKRDAFIVELFAEELSKIFKKILSSDEEPSIFKRNYIRSRTEMYIDVLSAIISGETTPTRILNYSNISWKMGKKILDDLLEKEFIEIEQVSQHRKKCQATEQGKRVLEDYKNLMSELR